MSCPSRDETTVDMQHQPPQTTYFSRDPPGFPESFRNANNLLRNNAEPTLMSAEFVGILDFIAFAGSLRPLDLSAAGANRGFDRSHADSATQCLFSKAKPSRALGFRKPARTTFS